MNFYFQIYVSELKYILILLIKMHQEAQSYIDYVFVFHWSFYLQNLELIALGMDEHNLANLAATEISQIWSLKLSSNISSFKFQRVREYNIYEIYYHIFLKKIILLFNIQNKYSTVQIPNWREK